MEERVSRRRLLAALGTVAGGSLAGCSFGTPQRVETEADPTTPTDASTEPREETVDADLDRTPPDIDIETPVETPYPERADSVYTRVYREVIDSVAAIKVETPNGSGSGTAWVYDSDYLVTNEHIVGPATSAMLRFNDAVWREAEIVASDAYSDLGVVRAESMPGDATPLQLVEEEAPVGTRVMAIGNPFGLSGSATSGIISGNNRSLDAPNGFTIPDAIQTDAAANPGNSGGPLVTLDTRVAGVVNSGIVSGDNIGFAISAALTKRVVPELIADGEYDHSYMGIGYTDVGPTIAGANNLPITWGIYVVQTRAGTPAADVLEGSTGETYVDGERVPVGGDVIVKIDDRIIQTQADLGTYLALQTSPGDTIDIVVIRDGRKKQVQMALAERPEPSA